uniref:aspartate-alanine antiporter n=1 Tax=Hafnia alvei TaxID=569 RepID=UPI00242AEF5C|nr:aspartate-alanine antiporter [Hafnia alvei]
MIILYWVVGLLKQNPELAIFLVLGIGYWIGSFKFGSFSLGAVTGTLLSGIAIGQLGIDISVQIKSIFFIMFLFSVGYGIGPQFIKGISNDGFSQAIFAVVVSMLCLLSVYGVSLIFGYGSGLASGLLAGTQTISASIGLATDAINHLNISPEMKQRELNNIPVAYAITYLFGTVGTGWIISFLGPKILRVNIEKECRRYEKEMSHGTPSEGLNSAWLKYITRGLSVEKKSKFLNRTVVSIENNLNCFVENIKRKNKIVDFDDNEIIQEGDLILISGEHNSMVSMLRNENEVSDEELYDTPIESLDIYITNKSLDDLTILQLSQSPIARGVFITSIKRGVNSVDIPILAQTKIHRGDIISVIGAKKHIEAALPKLGYADRKSDVTSMVFVAAGILIGGVLGSIVVPIYGVPITLSSSGGTLIFGLLFGWLQSFIPKLGYVPRATLWFMNSVGLNVFIAVVGISAGPTFVAGIKEAGIDIFIAGLIATSIPMLLAPLIGKYIFKFDPAINLGCCGGARTSTASVAMVADIANSNVPMLGYTIPYAVSNTFLTLWGLVIVLILS